MGGVFRKHGKWYIRYELGRVDGVRKQKKEACPGMTRKEAEAKLHRIELELESGVYADPGTTTVGELMQRWLEHFAEQNHAPKTLNEDEKRIAAHILPELGHLKLRELRPTHIQDFYTRKYRNGRLDGNGGLSPQTIKHLHNALHSALKQAVRWQLIAHNPAERVTPPKIVRGNVNTLGLEHVGALLAAARRTQVFMPMVIALTTGMRRGEILGLSWNDIDLDTRTLTVRRSLEQVGKTVTEKLPKTASSYRQIRLPMLAVRALSMHRAEQMKMSEVAGGGGDGWVCAHPDGTPLQPDSVTTNHRRVLRRSGIPHCRFHDLRHTVVTLLTEAGVPIHVVAELLGHSSVATTQGVYGHVLPRQRKQAADALDLIYGAEPAKDSAEEPGHGVARVMEALLAAYMPAGDSRKANEDHPEKAGQRTIR